jgi:c-di-GMP-binding flagellar brake protein YcgR
MKAGGEKRADSRVELIAQVQVTLNNKVEGEVHIMSTHNISLGGVFVQGDPVEYPDLQQGVEVELLIFNPDDPDGEDVQLRAEIVRIEKNGEAAGHPGFGLQFLDVKQETTRRLLKLVLAAEEGTG